MNTTQTRIDFGNVGWRLADVPITFGSRDGAIAYAKENAARSLTWDPPVKLAGLVPEYVDTRPLIRDVAKQLRAAENEFLGMDCKYSVGPWDEYFHVSDTAPGARWPSNYRWIAVFVVVGGSEGLYLHVEAIDCEGARKLILLGKTCGDGRETWDRCYESAARISWLLNN